MATYSFADCLANSYKVNWRIEDVLGARQFDPAHRWLPAGLSGASTITCLDDAERRKLTHVEMAAYAHLFGYVEEYIAPKVLGLASDYAVADRTAFDALTNFAAEEVKHMNLFRAVRDRVDQALGFRLERLGGEQDTARFVLGKSTAGVMLLTAANEWMTQRHYLEAFQGDAKIDPLAKNIFRAHWLEESQHAKLDHMETLRAFAGLPDAEREGAIGDVIELVTAIDGLLQQQTEHDLANLARYTGRAFDRKQAAEIRTAVLRAKRWTFIESGVTHPRFVELFAMIATPAQQQRVAKALGGVLGAAAA